MTKVPGFYNGLVSKRAKKMTLYSSKPQNNLATIAQSNNNNNLTATVTLDVYVPKNFNTLLSSSIPTSISTPTTSVKLITNRNRYMIKTNSTYVNISDSYGVSFSTTLKTYKNFMTKVFQFIQDSQDTTTTCYRIDSELHSLYSLDYNSSTGKLAFSNNWGNGGSSSLSSGNGYLCFKYTTSKKLQVIKRYSYDISSYTHTEDTSFTAMYPSCYVKYNKTGFTLVSTASAGSTFTIYNSKMNVSIPSDFNPNPTLYATNDRVSIADYISNTRTNIEGTDQNDTDCKFYVNFFNRNDGSNKVSDAGYEYANQIKNKGYDSSSTGTNYYANLMLTEISSKVASNTTYKTLRYATSVYKAFREGALSIVLKANCIANGDIGMNTSPYIYFTCEKDDNDQYHPFMCIASYSISDRPNRLMDVCKPPGDGNGAGYNDQNVTRDATLQLYLTKIPMLDYGLVGNISGSVNYGTRFTMSSDSNYYKTGVAITSAGGTSAPYYGSKTIITQTTSGGNDYLVVISDGDGFPAKAGVTNYTNDYSVERTWYGNPLPLTEQCFILRFRYRGSTNTTAGINNDFTTMGMHGIFLNGVALYNPSSGTGVIPGTENTSAEYTNNNVISGDGTNQSTNTNTTKCQLNAGFFKSFYGVDDAGGHPGDGGYIVDGKQGQYHYHNGTFITNGSWNNETFASSNAYFSSNYYTDTSGNIDYIRHEDGHSKIIGFCFDGYPIYGPYGYSDATDSGSGVTYMTSSYKALTTEFSERPYTYTYTATGTNTLTNRPYSITLSAGAFIDDYEYESGYGILDLHNGRYCVTPDYPNGTYAYFLSVDSSISSTYPYIIGRTSKEDMSFSDYYITDDQQAYVTIVGNSTSSGGSTTPTTGTSGVFNLSTLGVSSYIESVPSETYEVNTNTNDMYSASLAYDFIEDYTENGNSTKDVSNNDVRIVTSLNYNNYNYTSISGIGITIDGVSLYPVLNNTLTSAHKSAEITNTGIHVGQGMGLHYHADGYGAKSTTNNLCLYNDADYSKRKHPPLIGFGLDGIALYGIYKKTYSSMHGYTTSLDNFGGHSHGSYGYHYHAHTVQNNTSNNVDTITDGSSAKTYKLHILMKGAWKGKINDIPEFWDNAHGSRSEYAPEFSLSQKSKYVWGYTRN
jgi:hypothetical protein